MNDAMHIRGDLRILYGQATDAGAKPQNEDCLGIQIPPPELLATKGLALVVADGVSAAEAGREASEICVQGFLTDYFSTPETWQVKTAAHKVLSALNRWLYSEGQRLTDAHKGFVSALSVLVIKSRTAHIFHVGDTRVGKFSEGRLEALTTDHQTWVSATTRYLARAMGMNLNLEIDYLRSEIRPGDVFFLSTDGIHDTLSPVEIAAVLARPLDDPDAVCQRLIQLALDAGSTDNLSCQILKIDSLPDADSREVFDELSRLPFPPVLEPGMRIDGYEVLDLLSENPRTQLYLVKDLESGATAVMKTPSLNHQDDAPFIERFIMEEWIGRRIDSPSLVRILPARGSPTFLYYLMERVEGRTLREWMTRNPRPEIGVVVGFVRQIVQGLRALHRKETLHQDLKPDNLIVDRDGQVKIVDFGSTYIAGIHEIHVPFDRGMRLGTMRYSAPEYRLGRRPGTAADLFSLALVTYELLTAGKHPFGHSFDSAQTLRDFSLLDYAPAARHNPLVPVWIDGALKKALQINPQLRHASLSEFLHDLEHPNPRFLAPSDLPIMERNPVRFWQCVSGVLSLALLLLLIVLLTR